MNQRTHRRSAEPHDAVRRVDEPPPLDEVGSTIGAAIARASHRAQEHAEPLESVTADCIALTSEIFSNATADELVRRSHALRGVIAHGLNLLFALQLVAGELHALAAVRGAEEAEGATRERARRTAPRRRRNAP